MTRRYSVDDVGVWVPRRARGPFDVYFDGSHTWSFKPERVQKRDRGHVARWPRAMRGWLDGVTEVTIKAADKEVCRTEVRFGTGTERVRMVDSHGIPVMIDKWGLIQRPFTGRSAGSVQRMTGLSQRIIDILADELGLQAWLAFGSLLGAARSGKVIGHDSDVDLAYLSHAGSMVECITEMYEVTRVLRAAGLTVMNKSGGFVTVLFEGEDGAKDSIDVYSYFFVGENLYGNATVRAPAPASILEPSTTMEFEGAQLAAPADPDAVLTLSYGPGWRVPDPSFQHSPGPETKDRFDGWMGTLMRHRRDWERWSRLGQDQVRLKRLTPFATWALDGLDPEHAILDLGAGTGRDAIAAARAGHRVCGLDYARGTFNRARRISAREELPARFEFANLLSWRDTATAVAGTVHAEAPKVVWSRGLLDCLDAEARGNVYRAIGMTLGTTGGEARLEFAHNLAGWRLTTEGGGARVAVDPAEVVGELGRLGGTVVETAKVRATEATEQMAVTRMKVRWEARA